MLEDRRVNLAPIRYGLGQFIRTKFPHQGFGHEAVEINPNHQIIKIGIFESLIAAKDFESQIAYMLPEIIKVREKKYTTFVIPKSVLDKTNEVLIITDFIRKYNK